LDRCRDGQTFQSGYPNFRELSIVVSPRTLVKPQSGRKVSRRSQFPRVDLLATHGWQPGTAPEFLVPGALQRKLADMSPSVGPWSRAPSYTLRVA
jgi:hypothetical protein